MMTYNHWITQTKRGIGTPRSQRLTDIDRALNAYEKAGSGNKSNALNNLDTAIQNWKNSKGNNNKWMNSTRNSKKEVGGKGTVEQLHHEVQLLRGMGSRANVPTIIYLHLLQF